MGTWKFEVELFLPMVQTSEGENGGFPSKLTFQSIFSVEKEPLKFNNMNVRLRPWPESLESKAPINTFPHKYESACLEIHVVAMNEEDSLCLVQKSLETLLERFTFIIQLPLGTGILIQ
ncbi:MAG TPA: hypothetical protein EYN13_01110, partial [Methylococcales bacterium]|nr:hypothetical protein [Methylococcales bacterium]